METAESARAKSDETNTRSPLFYTFGIHLEHAIDERIKAATQCGKYNTFFACDLVRADFDTREKFAEEFANSLRSRGFRVRHFYDAKTGRLFLTVGCESRASE